MLHFERMAGFNDRFSDASDDYARYRPAYPRALAEALAERAPGRNCALEVGCGSGQLTLLLAEFFAQVVATDASESQIAAAAPHPRVSYTVAPAESTGARTGSADLIVAAQAAHWFDLSRFWAEAGRIGRPGALVAIVGYGRIELGNGLGAAIRRFHDETLAEYWPSERRSVVAGYADLAMPFAEEDPPKLELEALWSLDELVGYLRTWSAVKAAEAHGPSPVPALRQELAARWGPAPVRRSVRWPLFMRLGRLPPPGVGKGA